MTKSRLSNTNPKRTLLRVGLILLLLLIVWVQFWGVLGYGMTNCKGPDTPQPYTGIAMNIAGIASIAWIYAVGGMVWNAFMTRRVPYVWTAAFASLALSIAWQVFYFPACQGDPLFELV